MLICLTPRPKSIIVQPKLFASDHSLFILDVGGAVVQGTSGKIDFYLNWNQSGNFVVQC